MVSSRELEAVVTQVNAEFERLNARVAELENNAKEKRPTPSKSGSKRVQQTEENA
jgi:hypothetical protein